MRRKSVPTRKNSKSKDAEAGQDLVCVKSIKNVNLIETDVDTGVERDYSGELGRSYKKVVATRGTSQEVTAIVQMSDASVSDQHPGSGDGEKWSDSRCTLKRDVKGFC